MFLEAKMVVVLYFWHFFFFFTTTDILMGGPQQKQILVEMWVFPISFYLLSLFCLSDLV